ncbi:thymic stromal lymphopoietin [Otolemur garnettii]|uniref:thymic stromal lymphopoietin n=1 Tax=Otolemur garnettii TaxID=30611 RepID=UPI000C7F0C89|nr:thymic stromal lymphopoietin [Otolemur garnettii]
MSRFRTVQAAGFTCPPKHPVSKHMGSSVAPEEGGIGFPNTFSDALLFALSVFYRKIFILQLAGLVLTYDFTNCDFEKIREKSEIICRKLDHYMNKTKTTQFNSTVSCNNKSHCLSEIDRMTFSPTPGCTSLSKEVFALTTRATFALDCPGYPGGQIDNTQATTKGKKREVTTNKCLEQVSQISRLWRRFRRTFQKQKKRSLLWSYLTV